ncbi:hypothetical protein EEB19_22260 [Gordonia sp. OPL2]|nr:hypothetical protein EEB19_22260 [Gordonia sp. OPL2]
MKDAQLRTFSTRLPRELIHEVKVRSALDDLTVQEITDQALRLWLRARLAAHEPPHQLGATS